MSQEAVNFISESKKQHLLLWLKSELLLVPNIYLFISSSKKKAKLHKHKTQQIV